MGLRLSKIKCPDVQAKAVYRDKMDALTVMASDSVISR